MNPWDSVLLTTRISSDSSVPKQAVFGTFLQQTIGYRISFKRKRILYPIGVVNRNVPKTAYFGTYIKWEELLLR